MASSAENTRTAIKEIEVEMCESFKILMFESMSVIAATVDTTLSFTHNCLV